MPVVPGALNYQQSPLYDTFELGASQPFPTPVVFFAAPVSATKSKAKTNMSEGYKLSPPEEFIVRALRFVTVGMDKADILNLIKNYAASLIVSNKVLLEAPIEFWSGGAGLFGVATTTATSTTIQDWSNGLPDPRAIAAIAAEDAIRIAPGETFRVELNGTSFTTAGTVFLRCYLDGRYGRAVG